MDTYRLPADVIASQGGYTYKFTVTSGDLTATTTAQAITLISIPAGGRVGAVASRVKTGFAHATATTFTSTVGVAGSAAAHLGSQSMTSSTGAASALAAASNVAYTTTTNLIATFTLDASALNATTAGSVDFYVQITDLDNI